MSNREVSPHLGALVARLVEGQRDVQEKMQSHAHVQAVTVTTGSVPALSQATVTVTWPTAFPDTSYIVHGVSVLETTAADTLRVAKIQALAAGSITVRVENVDGSARTGTLHAVAGSIT